MAGPDPRRPPEEALVAALKEVVAMLGEQQQRIAELATTVEALTELVVELDVELANIDQTVFGDQRQALRNQSRRARFQASRAAARTEKLLRAREN